MRRLVTLMATMSVVLSLGVSSASGTEISDDPDIFPGFCFAFTYDTDAELIWLFQIHDPATGCLDGFPFEGHEITIEHLSEGVLWNVFGFDEGNIFQLKGVISTWVYSFDAEAVEAGTPRAAFLTPDRLVAFGSVDASLNITSTQADGDGAKVVHLVFNGKGTVSLTGGGTAAFTASVHEEVNTTANGLTASSLTSRINLRPLG